MSTESALILTEDKFKKSHQLTDIRGMLTLSQYRTENLIAKYFQQNNFYFADYIVRNEVGLFHIPK